jgi:MFS transporter, DHA1 family, inner membrane transport protein
MRNVLTALAIWCAGLGAAAQFGKMSVIYDRLGEVYPDHRGVGIGIMVSVIGIVGLIFGTTAGGIVMRLGARRIMLGALALGAGVSVVQSFLLPYPLMLFSRIPEGFSHLAIVVVGPTAIAATASLRWQGLVMTLWGSFFGLTFTVLAFFGPAVMQAGGVFLLFNLHAGWLGLCFMALAVLLPRDVTLPGVAARPGIIAQHIETYRSARIAAPAMGFVCYTVTYVAMLTLLPGAVQPGWAQTVAVAMPLVSIIVSLTLGVWLLGRMSAVRVVQAGFGVVVIAAVGLWATWGQGAWQAGFACLLAAAMGIAQGASFAAIPQLNTAPADRARAAGAIAQLGNLGTTTGTPALALILGHAGVTGMAVFLIGFSLLGIALHQWQARRRGN